MLLVISQYPSARLKYVVNFINSCFVDLNMELATDPSLSENFEGIIIEYSDQKRIDSSYFMKRTELLFEEGVQPIEDSWDETYDCPSYFRTNCPLGFDVFAALFFFLSRYEEYIPTKLDHFGRFESKSAIAVKNGRQEIPIVDIYINRFINSLANSGSPVSVSRSNFKCNLTIDIDIAYNYLGRSFTRTIGAFLKMLITFRLNNFSKGIATLMGLVKDEAFVFNLLPRGRFTYFVHVGKKGPLDKSCGLNKEEFKSFLRGLDKRLIGLHPSFQSHLNKLTVQKEKEKLESIAQKQISISRQHYIKMLIPETYEILQELGFEADYSMGWPDIPGYRAGTCKPHYFFNLKTNQQEKLKLYPFSWMDAHFIFSSNPGRMEELFYQMRNEHKKYGGVFSPIFHNNHFATPGTGKILWKLVRKECDTV